jgi:hypothetical protein
MLCVDTKFIRLIVDSMMTAGSSRDGAWHWQRNGAHCHQLSVRIAAPGPRPGAAGEARVQLFEAVLLTIDF